MSLPNISFHRKYIPPIDVCDLIRLDGLHEVIPPLRDLVYDLRIAGPRRDARGSDDEEGVTAKSLVDGMSMVPRSEGRDDIDPGLGEKERKEGEEAEKGAVDQDEEGVAEVNGGDDVGKLGGFGEKDILAEPVHIVGYIDGGEGGKEQRLGRRALKGQRERHGSEELGVHARSRCAGLCI